MGCCAGARCARRGAGCCVIVCCGNCSIERRFMSIDTLRGRGRGKERRGKRKGRRGQERERGREEGEGSERRESKVRGATKKSKTSTPQINKKQKKRKKLK